MNIIEALQRSKETGERFKRTGFGGAEVAFGLPAVALRPIDLLAEDWDPIPQDELLAKMRACPPLVKPCPKCCKRECICAALDAALSKARSVGISEFILGQIVHPEDFIKAINRETPVWITPDPQPEIIGWHDGYIRRLEASIKHDGLVKFDPQPDIVIEGEQ